MFIVGSACFALGSFPLYFSQVSGPVVAVTFFVGSLFFTGAASLQYSQAVGTGRRLPSDLDGWAAGIQLVGTLLFNVSTGFAISGSLSVEQVDRLVWAPDVYGSVAFLVSSWLAVVSVRRGPWAHRRRSAPRRIARLNMAGSVAFGIAAVGAFVIPATGDLLDVRWANAGTFLGALCFLTGAALMLPRWSRRPEPAPSD
ncbi:MAG TPA: hypothetical protein VK894_02905 [Jiangellales bacterium]|nr:hypothetical protein [Jiangellales bacterium]